MTQPTGKEPDRRDEAAPRRQDIGAQDKEAEAGSQVQGEGDYEAARRYRKDVREFVQSQDIEHAAREAEPHSREESEQLQRAEEEGRSHARN